MSRSSTAAASSGRAITRYSRSKEGNASDSRLDPASGSRQYGGFAGKQTGPRSHSPISRVRRIAPSASDKELRAPSLIRVQHQTVESRPSALSRPSLWPGEIVGRITRPGVPRALCAEIYLAKSPQAVVPDRRPPAIPIPVTQGKRNARIDGEVSIRFAGHYQTASNPVGLPVLSANRQGEPQSVSYYQPDSPPNTPTPLHMPRYSTLAFLGSRLLRSGHRCYRRLIRVAADPFRGSAFLRFPLNRRG